MVKCILEQAFTQTCVLRNLSEKCEMDTPHQEHIRETRMLKYRETRMLKYRRSPVTNAENRVFDFDLTRATIWA